MCTDDTPSKTAPSSSLSSNDAYCRCLTCLWHLSVFVLLAFQHCHRRRFNGHHIQLTSTNIRMWSLTQLNEINRQYFAMQCCHNDKLIRVYPRADKSNVTHIFLTTYEPFCCHTCKDVHIWMIRSDTIIREHLVVMFFTTLCCFKTLDTYWYHEITFYKQKWNMSQVHPYMDFE